MVIDILLLLAGTILLVGGGELLVRGAAALARALGVSPMVVGLTVVAYSTSAPELIVSAMAAWRDQPGICGGNIVGSNILNVLLVLGATATVYPLQTMAGYVRREVPIMIAACLTFWIFCADGVISHLEAGMLLLGLAAYTTMAVWLARRERASIAAGYAEMTESPRKPISAYLALTALGVIMLGAGSEVFLRGATAIAIDGFGMSETLVGLTLVAMGTSFPELAASLVAAFRKHPDICLGNIIGSSIYNILAIGGVAGMVTPLPVEDSMLRLHIPVMVGGAIIIWPMVATGMRLSRREGVVLLLVYAGYLVWIITHPHSV